MKSTSRRSFLKTAGVAVAATCVGTRRLAAKGLKQPVGIELYSVREQMAKDLEGTLAKVRAAGYEVAEAAGFVNRSAADYRKAIDNAGLKLISGHYTLALLRTQLDKIIEDAHTAGMQYIVNSSSGGQHRVPSSARDLSLDDWRWVAGEMNKIGEKTKAAGITLGMHNHTPEFATLDGVLVYDELLKLTDPNLVTFQMDCGWVFASGHDPVEFLKKTPKRFPLLHVKDMIKEPDGKEKITVLGKGSIDYGPIMKAATACKYYYVEQEAYDMEVFEELRLDAEYMRHLSV
jgi:sugar phosphate isomerase/epimerase